MNFALIPVNDMEPEYGNLFAVKEQKMVQKQILDLSDMLSFLSLLKIQNKLADLRPGDLLEVVLNDQATVADLMRIVNRSEDRIIEEKQEKDLFKIKIVKGININ